MKDAQPHTYKAVCTEWIWRGDESLGTAEAAAALNQLTRDLAAAREELAAITEHVITSIYGFAPVDSGSQLSGAVKSICDERDELRAQLTAANATMEKCKAAGFIDEQGNVRSDAISKIAAERARQVSAEGYTHAHDDEHYHGELAAAATEYASPYEIRAKSLISGKFEVHVFPALWVRKRGISRTEELVKAGALIAAEIDRLTRTAAEAAREGKGGA